MKIGYISQDWSRYGGGITPNGCTWYRCIVPANELIKNGIECDVGTLALSKNGQIGVQLPDGTKSSGHSIIVFKLSMHVSSLAAIDIAKGNGQKIVVDIDDWFDNLPDTNRAKDITDPEKNPINNRNIYFEIINRADAITCSTEFLKEFYEKKHPDKPVFLVRNYIDLDRWPKFKRRDGKSVIGWMGATPWRANDLEQLSMFIGDYIKSRKLKFHHSGHIHSAEPAHKLLGIDPKFVTAEIMQPISNLPLLLRQFNVGIVPLNKIDFNRAKSYLKGLEYAAAGIPFVASNLPEYKLLSERGIGRIANSVDDWVYHLDELRSTKMRQDEAIVGYEILSEEFNISLHADKWLSVFSAVSRL